jgi:membrane protease YdiL (CAAX protease family)
LASTYLFGPAKGDYRRTWAWATLILVPVFLLVGQILFLLPAKLLGFITAENVETYPYILNLIIGAFATAACIFIVWIKAFERRNLASAGLGTDAGWAQRYLWGFAFGLLMATSVVLGIRLLGGYSIEAEISLTAADLLPISILLFAFVLQAGTEEFIFRGWMMGRIAERYGLWAGVIGNSVIFTLLHVDADNSAALGLKGIAIFTSTTLLFSIFLSLLVIRERSIWGAAGWHASWNWMFITCFGLPTTGIDLGLTPLLADYMPASDAPFWLTGGADGPEGSVLTPIILVLGSVFLAWRLRAPKNLSSQH